MEKENTPSFDTETVRKIAWLKRPVILHKRLNKAKHKFEKASESCSQLHASSYEYRPEKRSKGVKYSRVEKSTEELEEYKAEVVDAVISEANAEKEVEAAIRQIGDTTVQMVFERLFGMLATYRTGRSERMVLYSKREMIGVVVDNLDSIQIPDEYSPHHDDVKEADSFLTQKKTRTTQKSESRLKRLGNYPKPGEIIQCYQECCHEAYVSYIEKQKAIEASSVSYGLDKAEKEEAVKRAGKREAKFKSSAMEAKGKIQEVLPMMEREDRRVFLTYFCEFKEDLYKSSKKLGMSKSETALAAGRSYRSFRSSVKSLNDERRRVSSSSSENIYI